MGFRNGNHEWLFHSTFRSLSFKNKILDQTGPYGIGCLIKWASSSKKVPSSMRTMYTVRSSCACAKYYPGLCSPFICSEVSDYSISEQGRCWSDCPDTQADLGHRGPHMSDDSFSNEAAPTTFVRRKKILNCWQRRPLTCLRKSAGRSRAFVVRLQNR